MHSFGFGGAERVAAGLYLRARARGESTRIAAPLGGDAERGLREEVGSALEGVVVDRPNEAVRAGAVRFARWARSHTADVVHAHLPSPDRLGAALIARAGRPAVITFHLLMGPPARNDVVFGRQLLRRPAMHVAHRVAPLELVALSRGDARLLSRAYGDVPITVVPNAPSPPSDGPPIALPFAAGTKLLCVGRLHRQKGFDLLIEALAAPGLRARAWSLCIVGEGEARSELETLVAKHGLDDRVRLVGALPATRVFASADLLISPSRYEGFPLTLLESIEARLPAVVSAIPVHEEAVGHVPSAVLPADTREWSTTLTRLIDDAAARASLAAAQRTLQERFSREAQDRAYAEIYARVLGGSRT